MPVKEQAKYTTGAERAARELGFLTQQQITEVAVLISRETHDAEMLEALKEALAVTNNLNVAKRIEAVIRKAEGRQ